MNLLLIFFFSFADEVFGHGTWEWRRKILPYRTTKQHLSLLQHREYPQTNGSQDNSTKIQTQTQHHFATIELFPALRLFVNALKSHATSTKAKEGQKRKEIRK